MIAAPLKHCWWWQTIGWNFVEQQAKKQAEWAKMDLTNVPQYKRGQGWEVAELAKAQWACPVCSDTHCPKVDLKDRILALAGMLGTDEKTAKVVLARIGDFEFNEKY